jgi:hypothetical protein
VAEVLTDEMHTRPHAEFVGLTALVLITRVADGITTHLATPDLARELNPLASGGWPALIAAAAVVVGFSTYLHYQHLFHPVDNFPAAPGVDLKTFKKHYFDPRTNPHMQPRPWRLVAYVFGYVTPRTLVLWSVVLVVNNLLTAWPVQPYVEFKRAYPLWIVFYLALPAIALLLSERLQRLDFARYQRQVAETRQKQRVGCDARA